MMDQKELRERIVVVLYGPMYAVPAALTVIGVVFFHVAAFGCKTFKVDGGFFSGYWSADSGGSGGCVSLGNAGLGGAMKFGRFIGVVGALMIWAIFAAVAIASFFKYPKPKLVFKVIGICMGVISFFSFLLLTGLSEDDSLKLAGGGVLAIVSAFIWAGAAVSMFFCMNEREPCVPARATPKTTEMPTAGNDPEVTINDDDQA